MGLIVPIQPEAPAVADVAAMKDALARLASGVTLVTCWDNGEPKGLAATSLIGLSVDPPRLLFSVRHEASAHDALLRGGRCAATILAAEDQGEAEHFAASSSAANRFASTRWRLDDSFAPRFDGGLAQFDLRIEHRIGADSHTIFIAEVLDVATRPGAPLIYFERGFAALG